MKKLTALILAMLLAFSAISCSDPSVAPTEPSDTGSAGTEDTRQTDKPSESGVPDTSDASTEPSSEEPDPEKVWDKKKDFFLDYSDGIEIALQDGVTGSGDGWSIENDTLTITKEGTYVLSGGFSNGRVLVRAKTAEEDVRLVLNNVSLRCNYTAPILCESCDKLIISLPEGTKNTVSDKVVSKDAEGKEITAAILSRETMVFNGTGMLTVNGNAKDGIASKDDLKIMEGTYIVNAKDDGISGKDSLTIRGGSIVVKSSDDGIKSSTKDDPKKGFVHITGGDISVTAGDDGIHAERALLISGGSVHVLKSYEGIEGMYVEISGGDVQVRATGNGLNASGTDEDSTEGFAFFGGRSLRPDDTTDGCAMYLSGGSLYIDSAGDGLDSNGSLVMAGTNVTVAGPSTNGEGFFDKADNEKFLIHAGKVIGIGSSGQLIRADAGSGQANLTVSGLKGTTNDTVEVRTEGGETLLSVKATRGYNAVTASCPEMTAGSTYGIYVNGELRATGTAGQE